MTSQEPHNKKPARGQAFVWDIRQKGEDLFENTNDLVQVFTPEGNLIDVNRAWREILEYSHENIPHLSVLNVIHPRSKAACLLVFERALQEGKAQRLDALFVAKSGREVAVEGSVVPLTDANGVKALRAILHDVTRHQEYEDLKDEFISTVSHELRTPLTVIREGSAQLRDGLLGELTVDQKSLMEMVIHNVDRLSRVINELLDISRLDAGRVRIHRSMCDIVTTVKEVIENFQPVAKQKGLELKAETSGESIELYMDPDKVSQILTNLVANALKFTEQGHVKITVRRLEHFVECKVSDTGRGISTEDLPKLFEKFHQFAQPSGPVGKGAGLGLAICKKLIDLHHGKISVESVPHEGTSVTILLPLYSPREIFREHIAQALNRCVEEGGALSLIIFDILNYQAHEEALGAPAMREILAGVEGVINASLRRGADMTIRNTQTVLVLLPDTRKGEAHIVLGRLIHVVDKYLEQFRKDSKIEIHASIASFPEDAQVIDQIIEQIYE